MSLIFRVDYFGVAMSSSDIKLALLETPLCKYLEVHELDIIINNSKLVSFSKGEAILEQGKKSSGLFIIIEGKAFVTAKVLGQGTTNLGTRNRGDFLGEISFMEKSLCPTSVIAYETVICLLIKPDLYEMLSVFFPETKYKISKALLEKIFDRIVNFKNIVTAVMKSSDSPTRSIFSKLIESRNKAEPIDIEEAGFNYNQLKKMLSAELFSIDETEELLKHTKLIKADNHVNIITENEVNNSVFIVLRGAVQSSLIQDNRVAKISVLGPSNIFSSISVLNSGSSSLINYKTCERAILLKIHENDLIALQKAHHPLWFKIFNLICKSFVVLERAIEKLDIRLNSELYNR